MAKNCEVNQDRRWPARHSPLASAGAWMAQGGRGFLTQARWLGAPRAQRQQQSGEWRIGQRPLTGQPGASARAVKPKSLRARVRRHEQTEHIESLAQPDPREVSARSRAKIASACRASARSALQCLPLPDRGSATRGGGLLGLTRRPAPAEGCRYLAVSVEAGRRLSRRGVLTRRWCSLPQGSRPGAGSASSRGRQGISPAVAAGWRIMHPPRLAEISSCRGAPPAANGESVQPRACGRRRQFRWCAG